MIEVEIVVIFFYFEVQDFEMSSLDNSPASNSSGASTQYQRYLAVCRDTPPLEHILAQIAVGETPTFSYAGIMSSTDEVIAKQMQADEFEVKSNEECEADFNEGSESEEEMTVEEFGALIDKTQDLEKLNEWKEDIMEEAQVLGQKLSLLVAKIEKLKPSSVKDTKAEGEKIKVVVDFKGGEYPVNLLPSSTFKGLRDELTATHKKTFPSMKMVSSLKFTFGDKVLNTSGRKNLKSWGIVSNSHVQATTCTKEERASFNPTMKRPKEADPMSALLAIGGYSSAASSSKK